MDPTENISSLFLPADPTQVEGWKVGGFIFLCVDMGYAFVLQYCRI